MDKYFTRIRCFAAGVFCVLLALLFFSCASAPKKADGDPALSAGEGPKQAEPQSTGDILARAAEFLVQGNFEEALALFDRINSEDAAKRDIRLLKASALISAGRDEDARSIIEDILSIEPDQADALFILANLEASLGKTREEQALLERIVRVEPENSDALAALGSIAMGARSYDRAASYYDQALKSNPDHGEALTGRAALYRRANDPRKAVELLTRAIGHNPSWATPLVARAQIYKEEGYPHQALEDLDIARVLAPDNYWVSIDRGSALLELMRLDEALEEFTRAQTLEPENFLAYVYTAGLRDDLKDYAGAERDYEKLVRLRSDYYFAYEGLGILKMRSGRWDEARAAFIEAYKQDTGNLSYPFLITTNWIRARGPADAKGFLAEVLRTVPRNSIEWALFRLFHDQSGDVDIAVRIDREQNIDKKAQMLYYLAEYYAIRGNNSLADRYYMQVREMNRQGLLEWKLNTMAIETRHLDEP
ncbi:MAG: tetratricopeptide repeat protein [Spirochaetaceae bacterium]|jgi:tetratricopeptide (TPR) repeat protein|nr:tetratricopeptide repeat protein [Spirochaetaceae bacterium]